MSQQQNKISLVVQAIDNATAVVKRVNGVIGRLAAPARAAGRSLDTLLATSGVKRLGKATEGVNKAFGHMLGSIRSIAATGGALIGTLGGMLYGLKRVADANDYATQAQQRFGATVTEWQKLSYAAQVGNASVDDLAGGLSRLNKLAVAAATGNAKAAQWFVRAGINIRNQNGHVKTSTQLLAELSDRFHGMADGPKKLALAEGLLGDEQGRLIPFMNGGAKSMRDAGKEAESLGLVNEQLARDSATFNNQLQKTGFAARGVGNAIASAFLPALNGLLPQVRGWIVANRALIATRAQEFVDGLKNTLPQLIDGLTTVFSVVMAVTGAINKVVQVFGGWQMVIYAVSAFMGGKLVFAILSVARSFYVLGAAIMTTPIGLITAGITALIIGGYLLIKHWDTVKKWFLDFIHVVLEPVHWLMEKIAGLIPGVTRGAQAASDQARGLPSPVSTIAGARAGMMGANANVKIEVNDKRTKVTEMKSDSPGVAFDVDSGYATAGMY